MRANDRQAADEALRRVRDCARRRSTGLSLCQLGLKSLPEEIAGLTHLTELDVAGNSLTSLPPQLGALADLTTLNLSDNQLGSLPVELGQLRQLSALDLSNNPLTVLPPEIGQLGKLTRLYLSHTKLTALPAEIAGCENLTRLYLAHAALESLPAAIGVLEKLTRLDLSHNHLTCLPPELGELGRLAVLDVSHNRLAAVPAELGKLQRLTVLSLADNRLAALPEQLAELPALDRLLLFGNPDLDLPATVLGPDPRNAPPHSHAQPTPAKSILQFYFARLKGATRAVNQAKVVLLGPAGAGKTTLSQALRELPFREANDRTSGIDLTDCQLESHGQPVAVHLWDFSSQPLCEVLHPWFLTDGAVCVVVLGGDHRAPDAGADHWLHLIEAHAAAVPGRQPPVIVALTHWNVPGCRPELDRQALRARYPFIRGFVELDCKGKKGIPALKTVLGRELDRLPWVRETIPDEWHAVHRMLAGIPTWLSIMDYRDVCRQHGVLDEGQQNYLIETAVQLGIVLSYQNDPRLHEPVLLHPPWFIREAYAMLYQAQFHGGLLGFDPMPVLPVTTGDARACLLHMLERFNVLRPFDGGGWLVPQALPEAAPAGIDGFSRDEDSFCVRFIYQDNPREVMVRLMVKRSAFVEEAKGRKQQWRDGLILSRHGARALVRILPAERQLTLIVCGPTKPRKELARLCRIQVRELHADLPGPAPREEIRLHGEWVAATTGRSDA